MLSQINSNFVSDLKATMPEQLISFMPESISTSLHYFYFNLKFLKPMINTLNISESELKLKFNRF